MTNLTANRSSQSTVARAAHDAAQLLLPPRFGASGLTHMERIQIALATPKDSNEIVHLLARVFSESEPPAVAMGLSQAEMEQFLRFIVPAIIPHQLTLLARSSETQELAGVVLAEDFSLAPVVNIHRISAKLLPILSMLETLDEQFRSGKTLAVGEYLHLFMLAVDARFAGRGIGHQLVRACTNNGLRKAYHLALTEATGNVSQHIFRKNGFAERFSVSYRDFVYQRQHVFASITVHEKAILMEKPLL